MNKLKTILFLTPVFFLFGLSVQANENIKSNGSSESSSPHEKLITYYPNGNKKAEKYYQNSMPVGMWRSWYEDGTKHAVVQFLGNSGLIEGIGVFYPSGKVMFMGEAKLKDNLESMNPDIRQNYTQRFDRYSEASGENIVGESVIKSFDDIYPNRFSFKDESTGEIYTFPWFDTSAKIINKL